MNPVLMIAYNNLNLTRNAVASVLAQDIPVDIHFVDNGSTDDTWEWAEAQPFASLNRFPSNRSPLAITNTLLASLFEKTEYILGVPNDVRLPSNCYRELLKWPRGFVCASDNGQNEPDVREAKAVSENTPMAVMLVRNWAYQAIAKDGSFFDEGYFHYGSDCDMALRMAACGIRGVQLDIPYWHFGSASLKLSKDRRAMELQADADRAYFEKKWGFKVDSLEYGQRPADLNFVGESR
jgi:GT2 family glycosyltransferase